MTALSADDLSRYTADGGRYVLREWWSGSLRAGRYTATADDGRYLATVAALSSADNPAQAWEWPIPGVAPLAYCGPLLFDGVATPYTVLLEQRPTGAEARAWLRPPLPAAEVARLGAAVAQIVAQAHTAAIVFQALRPEAIFLDPFRGGVTGLAPRAERLTALVEDAGHGPPCWDRCYLAPELLLGGVVGPAADWFSLSAVLWEWLTGRHPFSGDGYREQIIAIMRDDRQPHTEPTTALGRFLQAGLARHPAERPNSEAWAAQFAALGEG